MKKFIIIIYKVEGDDKSVKDNIKSLGAWFNYLQGSFLLMTTLGVEEIYNRIGTNKTGDRFLVMEVDLKSYWGILPSDAWDWLKEKKGEQGKW
jgi:hypothetical protein